MFAELRMQLSAPSNSDKCFVVVEGADDISLLSGFFSDECYMLESYGGKAAIEELMNLHFHDSRLIAVRDRDYEMLPSNERIFFCDYCNAEMMIVSNDIAF